MSTSKPDNSNDRTRTQPSFKQEDNDDRIDERTVLGETRDN